MLRAENRKLEASCAELDLQLQSTQDSSDQAAQSLRAEVADMIALLGSERLRTKAVQSELQEVLMHNESRNNAAAAMVESLRLRVDALKVRHASTLFTYSIMYFLFDEVKVTD